MRTTRHLNLVVLRETDDVRTALEAALAQADATDAPGLRRALEVLHSVVDEGDDALKIRWARQSLEQTGIPAGDTSTRAIKALRTAVPHLGLAEAVELVQLAAKH
ncbi:hypothetical protein [Streptomyces decoyicus]|uniref:hypothetical protein n=1 Tax=Streptomyces decoyicus TaxID=249567 RepID=UPI0038699242